MFTQNKYYDEYNKIIELAKSESRFKKDKYYETHHIIPKSIGGANSPENLVLLTGAEHYLCHCYLPFFTDGVDKDKMLYAWNFIRLPESTPGRGADIIRDSEIYEALKIAHAETVSRQFLGKERSDEVKKKISTANSGTGNGMYGKTHSTESKQKISEASKLSQTAENLKIITCPHCNKSGGENVMYRWHFDNCKFKKK